MMGLLAVILEAHLGHARRDRPAASEGVLGRHHRNHLRREGRLDRCGLPSL
jgi:hypothetical protein